MQMTGGSNFPVSIWHSLGLPQYKHGPHIAGPEGQRPQSDRICHCTTNQSTLQSKQCCRSSQKQLLTLWHSPLCHLALGCRSLQGQRGNCLCYDRTGVWEVSPLIMAIHCSYLQEGVLDSAFQTWPVQLLNQSFIWNRESQTNMQRFIQFLLHHHPMIWPICL